MTYKSVEERQHELYSQISKLIELKEINKYQINLFCSVLSFKKSISLEFEDCEKVIDKATELWESLYADNF
jgi:hypothetical protein